jgi:hypothetical protein
MAASPVYKVHAPNGEYVASCKCPYDALRIVSGRGIGSKIKYAACWVLWLEGSETHPAYESYDAAVDLMYKRLEDFQKKRLAKLYPQNAPSLQA